MELWQTPDFLRAVRKVKLKSKTPYSIREIWEDKEEILLIIKHEDVPVRRAAVGLLWDMKGGHHEVCLLRIKDARFKENYEEEDMKLTLRNRLAQVLPHIIGRVLEKKDEGK